MADTSGGIGSSIVLAFWRVNSQGETEFFVPYHDYMETMRHTANGNAARSARRSIVAQFGGLNPRSNARIFQTSLGCIVAFTLNSSEAESVAGKGNWLPITMVNPLLGAMLQDLEARL